MGADALGFNFAPGSRRLIRPDAVRDIVKRLPPETVTVGVFRDERPERVVEIVAHGRAHRRAAPRSRAALRGALGPPAGEVRDPGVRGRRPGARAAANGPADVILVDSPDPGSGRLFDWKLAEGAPGGIRLMLAGGLTADNVGDAIRRVRPWGVDVASGVESSPGQKDPRKLRQFIQAAHDAGDDARRRRAPAGRERRGSVRLADRRAAAEPLDAVRAVGSRRSP